MTDQDLTLITVILDRSASMGSTKLETIGGYNTFLADQKKLPGKALWTLAQFDDRYQIDYNSIPIAEVPPLNEETFQPRGMTALFDAIGRTIREVGDKLSRMRESDRPGKVVFLILTDGGENASHSFNAGKVKEMVEHQKSKYNWEFVFIGADPTTVKVANQMLGIQNSSQYDPWQTKRVYANLSFNVGHLRSHGSYGSRGNHD